MTGLLAKCLLGVARVLPRGGSHVVRAAARLDKRLHAHPARLALLPGTEIRIDLRESVCYPLWRYGSYPHQLGEDRLVMSLLRPCDVVWDIGANIGYTAVLYSHVVKQGGHVLAIEPGRRAYPQLVQAIAGRGNIEARQVAISDKPGLVSFVEPSDLHVSAVGTGPGGYEVRCVTLDELWKETGRAPDFIKIDVEGHEPAALAGGRELLRSRPPLIEFEALADHVCRAVLEVLADAASDEYRCVRCRVDGGVSPLGMHTPGVTNNYIAYTSAHRGRLDAAGAVSR